MKMKPGRPDSYSIEIAKQICIRIAKGEPLTKICKDDGMPSLDTVYTWHMKHPDFVDIYAKARLDQADTLADEMIEIADTEGNTNRGRLRVDTRKWIAAKLKPRKYGDSLNLQHAGELSFETHSLGELLTKLNSLFDAIEKLAS